MFRTITILEDNYPGLLAFLREELLENREIEGFHIFRYKPQTFSDDSIKIQLEIRCNISFEMEFNLKLEKLKQDGVIQSVETSGWRLQKRIFGQQGSELATSIMELSTEFAIKAREKFGKLIDPQNEYPSETMDRLMSPGAWLLFSTFSNAFGYSPIEEINAYLTAIQTRLQFMNKEESENAKKIMKLILEMI